MVCHLCGRPARWRFDQRLSGTGQVVVKRVCNGDLCVQSVRSSVPGVRLQRLPQSQIAIDRFRCEVCLRAARGYVNDPCERHTPDGLCTGTLQGGALPPQIDRESFLRGWLAAMLDWYPEADQVSDTNHWLTRASAEYDRRYDSHGDAIPGAG
jgi:hypothetical protein